MTAALFVPIVLQFDLYYDLNDDVLIKDILSGVYSGTPDGHTMQLLYPLGAILSLLYRGLSIPVFGVFLALCQFGSIWLIGYCTVSRLEKWQEKLLGLAAEGIFFAAAFGTHLVFLQYTVTAGMLACGAIFWVLTVDAGREGERVRKAALWGAAAAFLKKNLPALALYWLAFCLRSEMALLLLPLAAVAGLCRWGQEREIFTAENMAKYLLTFGVLAAGLCLCLGMDSLGYGKHGWPAFRQFFDDRTEVYDFQFDFVNDYEANADSYNALGISGAEQKLLQTYNFGVDDDIDTELMGQIRQAAVERPEAGGRFKLSLAEGLWSLGRLHWLGRGDYPLNLTMLLVMVLALAGCLQKGRRYLLWQVPLCLVTGSALWMFLLMRDRPVNRVLDPLYLAQIAVFAGLLLGRQRKVTEPDKREYRWTALAAGVLVLGIGVTAVPGTFSDIGEQYAAREENNRVNEAVMAYCSAHPATLFLEDVYSTVTFSEKITVDRGKPFNYDLLGGWLVKSPLTDQKLSAFGFSSMGEAILSGRKVCILAAQDEGIGWLTDYLEEGQKDIRILKTGTIADSVDVYQVVPDNGKTTWE